MSQSNRGMIAVVGGGCLLGLLLALGYVFYWSPKQKAAEARDEIRNWGIAWQQARTCLLGETPRSSDAHQALLARELVEDQVKEKLSACVSTLKALGRAEGDSTENYDVEKAWYALRIPVSKLAQAHAWRTAKTPDKEGEKLRRNLGVAIAALDLGYADLRRAAKMKPAKPSGEILPATTLYLSLKGPKSVPADVTGLRLRSEAVTYTVQTEESLYRARVPGGTDLAHFQALSPLALRAVDSDWGLWLEHDGIPMHSSSAPEGATLVAGPLDVQGEPAGDGTLLHTLAKGEAVSLSFATGDEKRAALFRLEEPGQDSWTRSWAYRLLTSDDSGATWLERKLPEGELWVSLEEATDNSNVIWTDPADRMSLGVMTITKAGIAEHHVKFPGTRDEDITWPPDMCQAPNRLWWVVSGAVYSMGNDGRLVAIPGEIEYDTSKRAYQFLCGDDYAAVHSQSYDSAEQGLRYQACSLQRCDKIVQSTVSTGDASVHHVFHQGAWHTIQELDGLVAIWRGGETSEPERLLRLDMDGELKGAVSWQDSILFLVWPTEAPAPSLLRAQ